MKLPHRGAFDDNEGTALVVTFSAARVRGVPSVRSCMHGSPAARVKGVGGININEFINVRSHVVFKYNLY